MRAGPIYAPKVLPLSQYSWCPLVSKHRVRDSVYMGLCPAHGHFCTALHGAWYLKGSQYTGVEYTHQEMKKHVYGSEPHVTSSDVSGRRWPRPSRSPSFPGVSFTQSVARSSLSVLLCFLDQQAQLKCCFLQRSITDAKI